MRQKGEGIRMNYGRPNYGNPNARMPQQGPQPGFGARMPQQTGYQPTPGYPPQQTGQGYPPQQGIPGYPPQQQPQTTYVQRPPVQPQQNVPGYAPRQNVQGYPQQRQQPNFGPGYAQRQTMPPQHSQSYPPQQRGYQQGFGQQNQGYPLQQRPGYQPIPQQGQSPYQQGYQYPQGKPPQGYGYTQPVAKQKTRQPIPLGTIAMIVLCGVLPVLFVLGLVFAGMPVLKWIFVALAVVAVAFLWIKPDTVASNVRLTFTGVYGALAIVALVSALTGTPPLDKTAGTNQQSPLNQGGTVTSQQSNGSVTNPAASGQQNDWTGGNQPSVTTPAPDSGLNSQAVEQLKSFFYFWSVNNQDNMLTLCAPSWQSSVSEPTKALFSILQNRIPLEYEVEKISGTDNDTARTVSVSAMIDKRNGRDAQKYRFQVIMKKEDGTWYVDPASLESNVVETTPAVTINITPEPPPTAMEASPDTVLYYNPDGGSFYHAVAECTKSTKPKYLPFKGTFTYRDINVGDYAKLQPCPDCGAPLREY